MNIHRQIRVLMALICVLVIQTCDQPEPKTQDPVAGDFASATLIHEYSPAEISLILQSIGASVPGSGSTGIRATKIKYYSLDHNQDVIELSGAIIYPVDNSQHPLLSIQHGTVTERTAVASVDPMNSSAGMSGLLTGALGYVTLIPDFAGYGDSHALHPYMHAVSLTNSVIDLIRAARVYCDDNNILLNEKLFLTGYSEGGYATLAAQRKMEMDFASEFSLTATAPMAGAYDLEGVAKKIFESESYTYPTYIAYLFVAYAEIYDLGDLSEVFNSPYNAQVSGYFDGDMEFFEINVLLPQSINELIRADFRMGILDGSESDYSNAFRENSLLGWGPSAPTRFYHGMADKTVPYSIAEDTYTNLMANGGEEIELIGIPEANHSTAGVPALMSALEWFATF